MECYYINAKFIDSKNITFNYSVNQYNMLKNFDRSKMIKLADIIAEITDGTRAKREYTEDGIKMINISDFKNGSIYPYNIKSISKADIKEKDLVKEGDVLLSAVGRSGQLAIVTNALQDYVVSSDIIRIRLKDASKAIHLVSYLNCGMGKLAIESLKTGLLNRISVSDVKEMVLPQNYDEINLATRDRINYQKKANKIFEECTQEVNKSLRQGELPFEITKMVFVDKRNLNLSRIDPLYYTYHESEVYKNMHRDSYGVSWQKLKDIVEIKISIRPEIDDDEVINYVNLSNIDSDLSVITNNETGKFGELSNRVRYVLHSGEIITAKVGSATGTENHITAVVTSKYSNMMASDAFYNIIPKKIDSYYLMFLFKQPIILKQFEYLATGLYFKSINRKDFENIRVPRIADEGAIASKMREYVDILQKYY